MSLKISKDAFNLWKLMKQKGGTFDNNNLKALLQKTVSKKLKDELIENGLMIMVTNKPRQIFEAPELPGDKNIEVLESAKKQPRASKKPSTSSKSITGKGIIMSFSEIMEQVSKYCQPYFDRIETIMNELIDLKKKISNFSSNQTHIKTINNHPDNFYKKLKLVYDRLNQGGIFGGEVPIPEIWKEINLSLPEMDWESFKNMLFSLEDDRIIDLHIANDPKLVKYPEKGIDISNRGLIYYISLRN